MWGVKGVFGCFLPQLPAALRTRESTRTLHPTNPPRAVEGPAVGGDQLCCAQPGCARGGSQCWHTGHSTAGQPETEAGAEMALGTCASSAPRGLIRFVPSKGL